MSDKVKGSLEVLNSLQISSDVEGMDAISQECQTEDSLLEFLSAIFYPHKKDFLDTVQK